MGIKKPPNRFVVRILIQTKIFRRLNICHKMEAATVTIEQFKIRIMVFSIPKQNAVQVNVSVNNHAFNL